MVQIGDPLENFPLQGKKDFRPPRRLHPYDNKKEEWPKCCHGDNYVVQVYDGGTSSWRASVLQMPSRMGKSYYALYPTTQYRYILTRLRIVQSSNDDEDNYNITRWVDQPAIYLYEEYIQYLQKRIFDLKREIQTMPTPKDENTIYKGVDVWMEDKLVCNDLYLQVPLPWKHGTSSPSSCMWRKLVLWTKLFTVVLVAICVPKM